VDAATKLVQYMFNGKKKKKAQKQQRERKVDRCLRACAFEGLIGKKKRKGDGGPLRRERKKKSPLEESTAAPFSLR